jgi:yecA family protein
MTKIQKIDFASAQAVITTQELQAHASEIHGVLAGLVCSGFLFEDQSYLPMLRDMFNSGDKFSSAMEKTITQMYNEMWTDILDDDYTFQLLLPDDDDSITERGHALGTWVQGFNLGFGLQNKDSAVSSSDVKEVLSDFAEIANLSSEMEEDEESEQAFFEISEYVRISALLCFSELGTQPNTNEKNDNTTIH